MDSWMIKQIEKKKEKRIDSRPRLELPLYRDEVPPTKDTEEEKSNRGVVVIELWSGE